MPFQDVSISLLLVDDEPIIVEMLESYFADSFDQIYCAYNVKEALHIYEKFHPQIIISDIQMPQMSGIDMLSYIRQHDSTTHVVLTSDHTDSKYFLQAINLQVEGCFIKPLRLDLLDSKIKKIKSQIKHQFELRNQKSFIDDILNAQTNFTVVTNGLKILMANQTMFDFFGFENIDHFLKYHSCICDFFIEESGYLTKEVDGKLWFNVILEDLQKIHKVKMLDQNGDEHIFIINSKGMSLGNSGNYIVVFTDVTNLEKLNNQKLQQEKQLVAQQKMVAMGEMIGHIAHQWRQPLAIIGTISSGLEMKKTLGILDDQYLQNCIDTINENILYLSDTINTFRNFLKEKKEFTQVVLQERIDIALKIVKVTLKDNNIKLINNVDYSKPVLIYLVLGELIEAIINIINNAKDVIKERGVRDPWVQIDMYTTDHHAVIVIEDSGGGIPEDVLPKIFDEYFSTKDEDTGTGLGLFMSKKIVQESLGGSLMVSNTSNGAQFTIKLPLDRKSEFL